MNNPQKVAILTSGHLPYDDRHFYHFSKTLQKHGYDVAVFCSTINIDEVKDNVLLKGFNPEYPGSKTKKIKLFLDYLNGFMPDVIICAEALPVIAASKYRKSKNKNCKLILDVTEWYPSKKNLSNASFFYKPFLFLKLLFFNIYTSFLCDKIMGGEYYKMLPYKLLFPFKPKKIISYYPSVQYFSKPDFIAPLHKIVLGYSGKLNHEKGFFNFLSVVKHLSINNPTLEIKLKIIGWFNNEDKEKLFTKFRNENKNINIDFSGRQDFFQFIHSIKEMDICLDLRKNDFENSRSLPIKIFYYAAAGKPVIYTKLKSIEKAIDTLKFGFLVNENEHEAIASLIEQYLKNSELYLNHSENGYSLFKEKYNWESIEQEFISFIKS